MPARHNWHILHIQTSRWDADLANEWWGCSLSGDYSALTTASQLSPLPKHISSRRQARGRLRGADLGLEGVLLWEGREGVRLQEHQSSGSVIFPHGLRPVRHFLALSAPMWLCAPQQIVTYMCTHTCTHAHTHRCSHKQESPVTVTLCHTSYMPTMTYWPTPSVCERWTLR